MLDWGKQGCFSCWHLFVDNNMLCAFSRELIAEGSTGGLVIFEDRPNYWDAWGEIKTFRSKIRLDVMLNEAFLGSDSVDVEIHHLETPYQLEFTNISVIASGPLRAAVRALVKYGKSTIEVIVSVLYVLLVQILSLIAAGRSRLMLLLVCV